MAKNVLIFFPHRLKETFGGAYSYLYQLKKAFPSDEVRLHFIEDLISIDEEKDEEKTRYSFSKELLKKLVPDKAIYSRRIVRYLQEKYNEPVMDKLERLDLSAYDAIHFHESIDLWRCSRFLGNYKSRILLTSHSPKPYHLELLEDVFGLKNEQISGAAYRKLEDIDRTAFSRADMLVSPCIEALDAYEKHWTLFTASITGKQQAFIPTGIAATAITKAAKKIRAEWKIKENAFVVCFNGRHNTVKGYDLLTEAAKILLAKNKNIYFLVTGRKDEPPVIKHEQWIETGWTTAPQDYVNAADLVVVPNRETYFDLNVLLALSLGKPMLLSNTGGNRFFRRFNAEGITFLEHLDSSCLAQTIEKLYDQKPRLASYNQQLQNLFLEEFSLHKFVERYRRLYLSI